LIQGNWDGVPAILISSLETEVPSLVVRAFTVHQVRQLISIDLPEFVHKYQVRSIIVPGLLNVFDEESNMKMKDMKKEISRIMEAINELSARLLVVTSVQQGDNRHSEPVLRLFKKRSNLSEKEKHVEQTIK
jgi:archaellum biogenesis ATPase FlaH